MVELIFETHSTSTDNEQDIASGCSDPKLSAAGERQAQELGERYRDVKLVAVYCSALRRSYETGYLAFEGSNVPLLTDARLNECDYGTMTRFSSVVIEHEKMNRIERPFPGGQSYLETTENVKAFLKDVVLRHQDKTILVIGHRATQYGLEQVLNHKSLAKVVAAPFRWQPGWHYEVPEFVN
ncbi:MAG: histidine phosphatase family protein [Patescibacteria group bacterium]|jgi:broad specificity phosphatase PhoE